MVEVGRGFARGVEGPEGQVTPSHEVVVADDDAGDGGEENAVGGEVGREVVG